MGYSLFSIEERVRILSGSFQGIEGTVVAPLDAVYAEGTVLLRAGGDLLPVTIWTSMDGFDVAIRLPPELIERINLAES